MKNYRELALRTESPVTIEMRERACFYLRLLHGAMGLMTEAVELQNHTDGINLVEELGDADWYLNLIRSFVGMVDPYDNQDDDEEDRVEIAEVTSKQALLGITEQSGAILDIMKRTVFYGKPLDYNRLYLCMDDIEGYIMRICHDNDIQRMDVRIRNIEKLQNKDKGRYKKQTFTEAEAEERNLEDEREVLGQTFVATSGPDIEEFYRPEDKSLPVQGQVNPEVEIKSGWPVIPNPIPSNACLFCKGAKQYVITRPNGNPTAVDCPHCKGTGVQPSQSNLKPLDETYNRYCTVCGVNRVYKGNSLCICTPCYMKAKEDRSHSPVQEC